MRRPRDRRRRQWREPRQKNQSRASRCHIHPRARKDQRLLIDPAYAPLAFTIRGRPVPKGRPRIGRGRVFYTPRPTVDYEQYVASLALMARGTWERTYGQLWPVDRLYQLTLTICINGAMMDTDNVTKTIKDALQRRVLWQNDRQVRMEGAAMLVGITSQRVEVTVRVLAQPSASIAGEGPSPSS